MATKQKLNPLSGWFDMVNSTGTQPGDVVVLDSNGKVPVATLPAIALNEKYTANSQAAMLALDAQTGDLCERTDENNKLYVLVGDNASVLANWKEMYAVTSVNGQTGDVTISTEAFKAFPATFNTTGTTAQFLSSIAGENLPVGSAYLGQVSLSDMPDGITVQGDVEVYIYPQNIVYAIMRSAEIAPYIWSVNSYMNRGREPECNMYNGTSAPSDPTAGMLWYNSSTNTLKSYNGTDWDEIQKYSDLAFHSGTGTQLIITHLNESFTPTGNFQILAGSALKEGASYLVRITTDTDYTFTLGAGMSNPNLVELAVRANKINQFIFLATSTTTLELQAGIAPSFATAQDKGLVKLGSDTVQSEAAQSPTSASGRTFPVQVNSSNQMVVNIPGAEPNTKTFFMSDNSADGNVSVGQEVFDRIKSGKSAIIDWTDGNGWRREYILSTYENNYVVRFISADIDTSYSSSMGSMRTNKGIDIISYNQDGIVNYVGTTATSQLCYLDTVNPAEFHPSSDYQPATKKYVDDSSLILEEGAGIDINEYTDYSALQGPCPAGFHMPTVNERENIGNLQSSLGLNNAPGRYLMPLAGQRDCYNNGDVAFQGTEGYYWSVTTGDYYRNGCKTAWFDSNGNRSWAYQKLETYGCSIRPFKNSPVVPDSSWTIIHDASSYTGIAGTGIFQEATLGLLSISADGQNWITIADKNLGATAVYHDGDTLDQTNCGNYYQWGNNYGFPWDGSTSITTDTTAIDASAYGPGNYYNSSTFIIGSDFWDNSWNRNLWGGITGVVDKTVISNTNVITSANAPASAIEGTLRSDTTNDVLKSYDGTNWIEYQKKIDSNNTLDADLVNDTNSTNKFVTASDKSTWDGKQDLLTAGDGITIFNGDDYSAMQGPCPTGFHVPTEQNWQALIDATNTLTITSSSNTGAYLKLPYQNGFLDYRTGNLDGLSYQDGSGYWTSTKSSVYSGKYSAAFYIRTSPAGIKEIKNYPRAQGNLIRPFKDVSVVPDNTWTLLYDGSSIAAGAGIFHNTTDGIISISADGVNWITIADKNLGATVVWNSGDTLDDTNSGKFYQWGNNYGFPRTGATTTSSTQVDASTYGPSNYYSDSTFVIGAAGHYDWSSVQNNDLWGGETGYITYSNLLINTQGFTPANSGNTGNMLAKTANGYEWIEPYTIPVYSLHGDIAAAAPLSFNVEVGGDYLIIVTGYHSGTINRDIIITVDGTTAAQYTSTIIQTFTYQTVVTAAGGSTSTITIAKDSDTSFVVYDVYIAKINKQSGYLTSN